MDSPLEPVQPTLPAETGILAAPRPFFWKWASNLILLPLIGLTTAFFGAISLLCGLWDKSGSQQHFIARQWARVMLRVALSPVTLLHRERLHAHETAVYACNHLSYYDTPVLFAKLPFQFRILARAPLWKIPFIGWYLNRSGQVPVDQKSARSMVASLGLGVKTLAAGIPLVLFPEGGRSAAGQPKKMVSGAAWMAIKAQVPLVPLTLVGTYELLPIHVYALHPRPLKLIVGEAISTAGMTTKDADVLTERMFEIITRTYFEHHPAAPSVESAL